MLISYSDRMKRREFISTLAAVKYPGPNLVDRITMFFVAVHESACGTFQTWRDVRVESAFGGKAEFEIRGRHFRY
jgi:hypothetical protein